MVMTCTGVVSMTVSDDRKRRGTKGINHKTSLACIHGQAGRFSFDPILLNDRGGGHG